MNGPDLIPSPDALPLPAGVPLLHVLLLVTFYLHVAFMNALLGGVVLALVARLRARAGDDHWRRLAVDLGRLLPTLVAGTVTLGVAPLLFLQVLYGQFFYTASILTAWPWLGMVVLVMVAYYALYGHALGTDGRPALATVLAGVAAAMLLLVAFVFGNVTTLMLTPARWGGIYFADATGLNLNLSEPMLPPRWLHMVLGAVAVGGLLLAVWERWGWRRAGEEGRRRRRLGLRLFTWATAVNILAGLWFFLALARPVRRLMMGDSLLATALFGIGFLLTLALLAVAGIAARRDSARGLAATGIGTAVLLADMLVLRDQVRDGYLTSLYDPASLAVEPQVGNLVLFALLLVAGLATVTWMVRRLVRS